ncbi:cytochrome P450 [Nocardioides piscis]|uniref:Cytochrome P450 n=1 Tax=Nocardioides piscis TaxID=2714938 RepID=A0A6G7YIV5_9ACTN|nr:cytochrome P450 [Nocardioides piscis]QIK76667.1 cytochrome P450 [Nocardioides piscis]
MTAQPDSLDLPVGFDPTEPDVNLAAIPHEELGVLRRAAPVHWVEQTAEASAGFVAEGAKGYWAITRHADIAAISKDSKHFSTSVNGAIIRFAPDMTRDQVEMQSVMMINQDDPGHGNLRRIISRGFTPRAIGGLRDALAAAAVRIAEDAREKGTGCFVEDVASELPLQAIADLLGVPQEDRRKLFHWSNQMLSYDDPEIEGDPEAASVEILNYFMPIAEERKANPQDDIVSKLVTVGEDGEGLTSDEFGFFVILLTVAGNETSRNSITHGMKAFFDHPDQWELYKKERPATAVDEIIRWATPVSVFQRTALADVMVGDVEVKKDQRVGIFYASGNFDDEVFEDPFTFDIMRDPNPHLAFGGHGAHYCIGANLARLTVGLMFEAIADTIPDISLVEDPRRLRHSWINGIKEMQVKYA